MPENRERTRLAMSQASNPLASLIIAVYNNPAFLEKVLLSLKNQAFREFEIIISDDGSGPGISEIIKKHTHSFEYPIQHQWHEDKGFRKTIIANKSIMKAAGDYLIFIDGDCLLHHNFVKNHYKHKKENTVLVGRRVMLDQELTDKITEEDILSKKFEKYSFWKGHCDRKSFRHGFEIPFFYAIENLFKNKRGILGCNYSLHKQDVLKVNGYDETIIGRGIEDNNLCARLEISGIIYKSVIRQAIQFHLFHSFDPVPHSKEFYEKFCNPEEAWTRNGILKE